MSSSTMRMLLAVALSAIVFIVYLKFFSPQHAPKEAAKQKENAEHIFGRTAQEKGSSSADNAEEMESSRRKEEQPTPSDILRAKSIEGKQVTLQAKEALATFTSTGAALRHWVLTNPRYMEHFEGNLRQVDLVKSKAKRGPWPLSTTFPASDFDLPPDADFKLVRQTSRRVNYLWQSDKVSVFKSYSIDPDRSMIWMTLKVKNITSKALRGRLEVSLFTRQDPLQEKAGFTNPYPKIAMGLCYVNGKIHRRSTSGIQGTESGCSAAGCGMESGEMHGTGDVLWIGTDDRYFLTAITPLDRIEPRRCEITLQKDEVIKSAILYPEKVIEPRQSMTHRLSVFVGAKDLNSLDVVKGPEGTDVQMVEAIEFGWFAVLCRPMLWLLKIFFSWLGNWGLAIILLTIVVKLITLYWTQKSMRSMKEMQRLKPKMDALKEKYADDKQRLNQEIMSLYKLHKVNPLGGCLPMLLQMPIWFALYRTLGNAVELYRSGFVGWITDLTAPDQYYVLPIALGIAMFGQQAISPQPLEGNQAKMMKYFMPGMFTVMMIWLPAGLTLYIFVNTVLTTAHQWYMNKTDPYRKESGTAKKKDETKQTISGSNLPTKATNSAQGNKRRRKKTRQ